MTTLFANLESRGLDAAGIWATESGKDGCVLYHKEPVSASEFVDTPFWNRISTYNINLMLVHARGATKGMGTPSRNQNNHPFVSQDRRLGLIHNGVIYEAANLRKRYQTLSDCDSEVLLRIFEAMAPERSQWLQGVKEIWSLIRQGHMAAAFGERHDDGRSLYLFRNDKRPLWIADLREDLGQIFFFSSVEIWGRAVARCRSHLLRREHMLIELPVAEAWHFELDKHLRYSQYKISVKPKSWDWNPGKVVPISPPRTNLQIVTQLDDRDNVITKERSLSLMVPEKDDFEKTMDTTQDRMRDVLTDAHNLWVEGSLSDYDIDRLLTYLEDIGGYIDRIAKILER